MSNENQDESLGVEQLPQDELEAVPQSDQMVPLAKPGNSLDHGATAESESVDVEESRDSKQPRRVERDRRIATD